MWGHFKKKKKKNYSLVAFSYKGLGFMTLATWSIPVNEGWMSEPGISSFWVFEFYDLINIFNVIPYEWSV